MALSVDNISSTAVLINNTSYPKDDSIQNFPDRIESVNMLSNLLEDKSILGIPKDNITVLHNALHNTTIKEGLATAAEHAKSTVLVYFNGYVVVRKGELFLATINSTRKKAHINGISLQTVVDIISESKAENKILLFDVNYVLDNDDVPYKLEKIIKAQFDYFENELRNSIFLSVAPGETYRSNESQVTFTEILTNLIKEGLTNENTEIKVSDLCQPLADDLINNSLAKPLKGKKTKKSDLSIAYNKKFIEFQNLKEKADKLFDINDFFGAFPLYQKAQRLYENNNEVLKKVEFINIIELAESFFSEGNYVNSRFAFEKAYKLINIQYAKRKALEALEKIANEFYEKEDFEMAKVHYEILVEGDSDSKFYKKRLNVCVDEIKFAELTEEGDKFYFAYDYHNALKFYEKALKINHDTRISKRKETCERFVEKESEIRKEIEKELKSKSDQNYEKELKQNLAEKESDIKKELEPKLRKEIKEQLRTELESKLKTELKDKVIGEVRSEVQKELAPKILQEAKIQLNKKFEMQLWESISKSGSIELYEYYINSFPKGFHVEDAKGKIENLKKKQEEKIQEEVIIEKETEINEAKPVKEEEDIEEKPIKKKFDPPNLADIRGTESVVEERNEPVSTSSEEMETVEKIEDQPPSPANEPEKYVETETDPEKLWIITKEKNTLEAYTYYVENIEDSSHVIDAYYMINKLRHADDNPIDETPSTDNGFISHNETNEIIDYNDQKETDTIAAKEEPISNSDTNQLDEELVFSDNKDEESLWKNALEIDNVGAYYNYLNTTTQKTYWDEAKQKIAILKNSAKNSEYRDWEKAQSEDTIYAYKEYIKKYPLGSYYAKAMFKINKFEGS